MLRRHWVAIAAGILLSLVAVGVAADYLGPDRTRSIWVWQRRQCHYQAVYIPPTPASSPSYYACQLYLYYEADASCPAAGSTAPYFNNDDHACGASWPGTCGVNLTCRITKEGDSVEGCREGQTGCRQVEQVVTYPEATVQGELQGCVLRNGWCITLPALSLSAEEPLDGYRIMGIEGTHNGARFYCEGAACTLPLVEGENAFTYWAFSSWGDTSRMGSLAGRVDTRPPQLQGEVSGTAGENGWYVSPVTFTALASDPAPGSGVVVFEYMLDGG